MAIYTPTVQTQVVGGTTVQAIGVLDLNSFNQQIAVETFPLDNFTIQASSLQQLAQPIGLVTKNTDGTGNVNNIVPVPDVNKPSLVLPKINADNFVLSTYSSITYTILPGEQVHMILQAKPGYGGIKSTQYFKEQTGGPDSWDYVKDLPLPAEYSEPPMSSWALPLDPDAASETEPIAGTNNITGATTSKTEQKNSNIWLIVGALMIIFATIGLTSKE